MTSLGAPTSAYAQAIQSGKQELVTLLKMAGTPDSATEESQAQFAETYLADAVKNLESNPALTDHNIKTFAQNHQLTNFAALSAKDRKYVVDTANRVIQTAEGLLANRDGKIANAEEDRTEARISSRRPAHPLVKLNKGIIIADTTQQIGVLTIDKQRLTTIAFVAKTILTQKPVEPTCCNKFTAAITPSSKTAYAALSTLLAVGALFVGKYVL